MARPARGLSIMSPRVWSNGEPQRGRAIVGSLVGFMSTLAVLASQKAGASTEM